MPSSTRSRDNVRPARSRTWTAVIASLTAMAAVFVALMALELGNFATSGAPTVVVADSNGPAEMEIVTLTKEQFETSATPSVTLRLSNNSAQPVEVAVTLNATTSKYAGTLTAALTLRGAVVRNGPLSSLRIPSLMLDAKSTTPVTLDLDIEPEELDELWGADGDLAIAVAATAGR